MILLECVYAIFKRILRFCIWFITARDCEHCTNGTLTRWGWKCDMADYRKGDKCKNSLCRCYFERKK